MEQKKGEGGCGGRQTPTTLQNFPSPLNEGKKVERELLVHVLEQAHSGRFESLLTMWPGVDSPNISRQIPILIL